MAPVVLLVGRRPLAEPLAESSSSRTGPRLRPRTYNLAAFPQQRRPEKWPTPLPGPHAASPEALPAVPARSFLLEIRPAADIKGSPVLPALEKGLAPPS